MDVVHTISENENALQQDKKADLEGEEELIPDIVFDFPSGIKRFSTSRELRLYLRELLTSYEKTRDAVDAVAGDMIRDGEEITPGRSKGWFKVGNLFANRTDPTQAGLDILFQILRETKPKVLAVEESLRAFDRFEALGIPDETTFLLYLREGVPERIVIGGSSPSV